MHNNRDYKKEHGFTLIELLIVIAIIAILAVTVIVALDPITRFADARNSRRYADTQSILTAVHEYIVDNSGSLPTGLSSGMSETQLGTCGSGGATLCTNAVGTCVDLSTPLAKYLSSIPIDSADGSAATTGYSIVVDSNNIVTVKACAAENDESIEVSR